MRAWHRDAYFRDPSHQFTVKAGKVDGKRVETLLQRPAFAFAVFAIATATTFFTFAPDLVVTAQRGAIALSALLHRAKRKCQAAGNLEYIFF
jgi:hypothetical protein